MNRLTPRLGLLAGLALVVLTNAVTLGLVAWNRSGEPEVAMPSSGKGCKRQIRYCHQHERQQHRALQAPGPGRKRPEIVAGPPIEHRPHPLAPRLVKCQLHPVEPGQRHALLARRADRRLVHAMRPAAIGAQQHRAVGMAGRPMDVERPAQCHAAAAGRHLDRPVVPGATVALETVHQARPGGPGTGHQPAEHALDNAQSFGIQTG